MSLARTNSRKRSETDTSERPAAKKRREITDFATKLDGTAVHEDAQLLYTPNAFAADVCRELMQRLKSEHTFTQDEITVHGRKCLIPRKQVLVAKEAGMRYRYSSITMTSVRWLDAVERMCAQLSAQLGVPLNACLINWYRDGKDHVSAHPDKIGDMEHDVIATVSLGETRLLRVTGIFSGKKYTQIELRHGSLFVMKAGMQSTHKHEIPREARKHGERISLTFRQLRFQ